MNLIPKKYFMLLLAALLVVALGYMAVATSSRRQGATLTEDTYSQDIEDIEEQPESDDLDAIEDDLDETDTDGVDEELENIGKELDS